MKKLIYHTIFFFSLCLATTGISQNNYGKLDDVGRIALVSYMGEQSQDMPSIAQRQLKNKLDRIASANGMGGNALDPRFIITAKVDVISQDIVPSAPPMHAYTLDIGFFIGDGIEGTLFSNTAITSKGVGINENKAFIAALKNIKTRSPIFEDFIAQGKQAIMEYYNTQCDFIITEAESLKNQDKFDEAISKLMAVPDVSKECYDKCMQKASEFLKLKLEHECQQNIAKAKSLMAQDDWDQAAEVLSLYTPELNCYPEVRKIINEIAVHRCSVYLGQAKAAWSKRDANLAGMHLGNIPTDSECAGEAQALGSKIAASLDAQARRKWELAYEKYNRDQVMKEQRAASDLEMRERDQNLKEQRTASDLEMRERDQRLKEKRTASDLEMRERDQNLKEQRTASDLEMRERNQKIREQDAASQRDLANREMQYKENYGFELEKARINAAKEVGVAYGENQPKTKVSYNVNHWW